MNYLENLLKQYAEDKNEILAMLPISESRLNELIFEEGTDYLIKIARHDETTRKILDYSAKFWNWWKIHWSRIDHHQLPNIRKMIAEGCTLQYASLHYYELHQAEACKFYPGNNLFLDAKKEYYQKLETKLNNL